MKKLRLLLALSWVWVLAFAPPAHAVLQATQVGDAAYTVTSTDTNIITTTAFSAARTWTLAPANATCIGQSCAPFTTQLVIYDAAGAVSATNTLTIARPTGGTINGNAANLIISAPKTRIVLVPTSATNWDAVVTGDFRSSTVAVGDAVALTTATAADITSISLSQGEWSCTGTIARTTAATTSVTLMKQSISATTATSGSLGTTMTAWATAANVVVGDPAFTVGPVRLSLAATTTYYLVAEDTFTVDTNAGYGSIVCQRMK